MWSFRPATICARSARATWDALVSWWVVNSELGGDLERSLNTLVPSWLPDRWGFHAVHYAP